MSPLSDNESPDEYGSSHEEGPIFSICIPTFNGEATIIDAVSSVLRQSLKNFEVVVSDDGSKDRTRALLQELVDSRLRVEDGPATGNASDNWNHCVSLARGTYIKVMGQDDILSSNALERELNAVMQNSNEDAVVTFCKRQIITASGRRLPLLLTFRKRIPSIITYDKFLRKLVRTGRNVLGEPVCVSFRRDAFEKTQGFYGSYLIDLALWTDLLKFGKGIYIDEVLCFFRISRRSWTFQLRGSQATQTVTYFQRLYESNPGLISRTDIAIGTVKAFLVQYLRHLLVLLAR